VNEFVFGYGSLVEALERGGSAAELRGHRRRWAVAMDNRQDLPGYKYYVDVPSGERPAVYVAFLDLTPDPSSSVNGIVFPVDDDALTSLDARERNYGRREVTRQVSPPPGGRVWAYFGTPEAHERFQRGRSTGTAVVSRTYSDGVRAGFSQLGPDALPRFDASTDDPPVPIRDLRRIDLPPT
jgi:gamma-glutamylcyclotransferase (GGCT)/AIG2-like uncharacterized protein YtfP